LVTAELEPVEDEDNGLGFQVHPRLRLIIKGAIEAT
jgi:hypothetical protein